MQSNPLSLILSQVATLITVFMLVAVFVELILEALQPLITRIKDDAIRTTVNLLAGAILGTLTAWGMRLSINDYLTILPVAIPIYMSYLLIGCAAGAGGSRFWHAVLGFLQNLKLPTMPPTTPPATPPAQPVG